MKHTKSQLINNVEEVRLENGTLNSFETTNLNIEKERAHLVKTLNKIQDKK